jgi:thiosulfate/3-mercaptopyruvate sulfurtransferase
MNISVRNLSRTRLHTAIRPQKFSQFAKMNKASGNPSAPASLMEADQAVSFFTANSNTVKVVDGSWHMDKTRVPIHEFIAERISGAQYFDIDKISDTSSPLPHMVPTAEQFSEHMSNMGISNDDHVLVYVKPGAFSAARVWWMFRLFGHTNVSIINGGINAWKSAGGPVSTEATVAAPTKTTYTATINPNYIVDWKQVLDIVNTGAGQIADARSLPRFNAEVAEPRPGLVGGHIPGSLCLPFTALLQPDDVTKFRSPNELKDAVMDSGIILGANVVFSCGSGVTASVLYFAVHLLGIDMNKLAVYDGSWTEWAQREDLPKITPAKK